MKHYHVITHKQFLKLCNQLCVPQLDCDILILLFFIEVRGEVEKIGILSFCGTSVGDILLKMIIGKM